MPDLLPTMPSTTIDVSGAPRHSPALSSKPRRQRKLQKRQHFTVPPPIQPQAPSPQVPIQFQIRNLLHSPTYGSPVDLPTSPSHRQHFELEASRCEISSSNDIGFNSEPSMECEAWETAPTVSAAPLHPAMTLMHSRISPIHTLFVKRVPRLLAERL